MRGRIGVVSAFMEERPGHSRHHIAALVDSLGEVEGVRALVVANGVVPSAALRQSLGARPFVTVIEVSPNIGLPLAWNMGIDLIDADVLFFLNDDLKVDARCIDEIAEVFRSHPDTAVCGVEGVISKETTADGYPASNVKYRKQKALFKSREVLTVSAVGGFLFAVSGAFMRETGFRFDPRFTPAFCEEFDLAFFARKSGYKTRIVTGLDRHYDHSHGISSGPREVRYLGRTIMSDELAERNKRLFCEKWGGSIPGLLNP